jgi:hypothetical protein
MATQNPVVDGEDPNATRSRILNGNIVLNDLLPTEAKDLIRKVRPEIYPSRSP